ncbi:hypothetical protein [Neisseria sp. Ec49-e6-T10]|uniref:hypothetical protein n=1 Tax=Neisseria sp. Ec49-e6-T10 TaxID=3140744 RepID=UPI003EBE416F
MAFVNEYIPAEDFKKYDFDVINKRWNGVGNPARQWAINREKDIWLRKFYTVNDHTAPDGGYTGEIFWDFYWKGTLMSLKTKKTNVKGGGIGEFLTYDLKVLEINIPSELSPQKEEIFQGIKDAFVAYAGGGIFSESIGCEINFDFTEV